MSFIQRIDQRSETFDINWQKLEMLTSATTMLVATSSILAAVGLGLLYIKENASLVVIFASLGLITAGLGMFSDHISLRLLRQSPLTQSKIWRMRKVHIISCGSCALVVGSSLFFGRFERLDQGNSISRQQSIVQQSLAIASTVPKTNGENIVTVGSVEFRIGSVQIVDEIEEGSKLEILVEVRGASPTTKIDRIFSSRCTMSLRDELGNRYAPILSQPKLISATKRKIPPKSLYPDERVGYRFVFEPPVDQAKQLKAVFCLPPLTHAQKGVEFRLPKSSWSSAVAAGRPSIHPPLTSPDSGTGQEFALGRSDGFATK